MQTSNSHAHMQAALQQAAASSGGMTNPAVFSGIFQGIHGNQGEGTPTSSATNGDSQPQLSMLLPTQQQVRVSLHHSLDLQY